MIGLVVNELVPAIDEYSYKLVTLYRLFWASSIMNDGSIDCVLVASSEANFWIAGISIDSIFTGFESKALP